MYTPKRLLLTSLANLYGQLRGGPLPPHLSMHSRNDLTQDARMLLDEPCFHCFLQYTQALSRALPSYRGPAPAEPISLQGNAHSRAETLAMQILAKMGSAPCVSQSDKWLAC